MVASDEVVIHPGDCLVHIGGLLDGSVNCMITDPPYGVDAKSSFARTELGQLNAQRIMGDKDLEQALNVFQQVMLALEPKWAEEVEMYVFTSWGVMQPWMELIEEHGFTVKMPLIWAKGWPGLGDLEGNWGCGYEVILYCKRGRRPVNSRRSAILSYDKPAPGKQHHPHEKPVTLLESLVRMSTDHGDLIIDPFAGSGSTLVAAQNMQRGGWGCEMDPKHYRTASDRLSQMSWL